MKKIVLIILVVALVVVQFFPTEKNLGKSYGENDFTHSLFVSEETKVILENACFDCHSNHTKSTWYSNIQPVAWWMANHVEEGKEELNFSEFNSYKNKKKAHKLEEIAEQIEKGEMAPTSYTLMHGSARLSNDEKNKLISWANASKKEIEANIPK